MDNMYRFSPIESKEKLIKAVKYIAFETTKLCKQTIGRTYPISSLTVFAHYSREFETLSKLVLKEGVLQSENNGPFVELHQPIQLLHGEISLLRIRKPDPYRFHVGCNDFEVPNYEEFKKSYLGKNDSLRLITRPEYEMIEFFHPDYDVLAYVCSKPVV